MKGLTLTHLQSLFIGIIAMSMISPPIANLLEVLLIIGIFFAPAFRENFIKFVTTVDFKIQFAFMALLLIGFAYPLVDPQTYAASILSWRKFLLLPLGFVLFADSPLLKSKALRYLFYFILVFTLLGVMHKSHLLPFFNEGVIKYQLGSTSSESMYVAVALAIVLSSLVQKSNLLGVSKWTESLLAMYLVGYVAMFTTGRSGYVAMLIVLAFMAVKYWKTPENKIGFRTMVGLLLVMAISTVVLMSSKTSADRINQAVTEFQYADKNASENNVTSIGQRINFWKNTVEMIPDYFLLGTGTGGFQAAYAQQVKNKTGMQSAGTQDPHNQYMKILVEQGALGLMLFLYLIARALFQPNVADANYIVGSAVISIWIVTSCFNAHFTTFMEGTFIWAWMGLMNRYKSENII